MMRGLRDKNNDFLPLRSYEECAAIRLAGETKEMLCFLRTCPVTGSYCMNPMCAFGCVEGSTIQETGNA